METPLEKVKICIPLGKKTFKSLGKFLLYILSCKVNELKSVFRPPGNFGITFIRPGKSFCPLGHLEIMFDSLENYQNYYPILWKIYRWAMLGLLNPWKKNNFNWIPWKYRKIFLRAPRNFSRNTPWSSTTPCMGIKWNSPIPIVQSKNRESDLLAC